MLLKEETGYHKNHERMDPCRPSPESPVRGRPASGPRQHSARGDLGIGGLPRAAIRLDATSAQSHEYSPLGDRVCSSGLRVLREQIIWGLGGGTLAQKGTR